MKIFKLIEKAKEIGAELTEMGAPRGEKRLYVLKLRNGVIYESFSLSCIENKLTKQIQGPKRIS